MFIVYLSEGTYSDYSVEDEVLYGDVDPKPIIDAHVASQTGGRFSTLEELDRATQAATKAWLYPEKERRDQADCGRYDAEAKAELERLEAIKKSAPDALIAAGFRKTKAMELWLGD